MFGCVPVLMIASVGSASPTDTLSSPSNRSEASEAAAETAAQTAFEEHPLSFELRLGIATPTGGAGLAVEYSFVKELALGCGVGTNARGWEPGCWLRGRLLVKPDAAWTMSSGFSTSTYAQSPLTQFGVLGVAVAPALVLLNGSRDDELEFQHAYWWNTDIGLEVRPGAFVFREFLGVAALLNPGAGVPTAHALRNETAIAVMAYAGVGVGFAP